MLHHIINSDDELCHVTIYDWLIQSSQSDKLLQVKIPLNRLKLFLRLQSKFE